MRLRQKKLEQVEQAEQFLQEVAPEKTYPYELLCFRITGYRPESVPRVTMAGEDVQHDLRLFIEDVSDAAAVRVEDAGQPVYTVEELSKMFNVSTKTISRWRSRA